METTTCPHCSRSSPVTDARGLAWSSVHHRDGSVTWVCPECTRSRLSEIETLAG